ncbi:glycoside hydrolase family 88 protein [Paenibacillus chondroitinus]|uniref:Glycoside hydrolase family 88 protein n=1 Tax=Paenibacillus chondroitinus TaxID=59842 RepID=A0ABU6DIQ8_9BACL|nr:MULTISPECIES: glycoside hydrolase family 88 protein [Paenibacillus]MCY9660225.1 glycoside hydrolase family 88 protein [Paenibacillus anseongense]MEB4797650.1 glycoside hydrolase family 88 protein [Paenibacillus chondroitinus]
MTTYFNEQESIQSRLGQDEKRTLKVLADRYIGANPPVPFAFRAFNRAGMLQNDEGLFDLNLHHKFPEAKQGQISYAYSLVWSDSDRNLDVLMRCLGPIQFYFNNELSYRSNVMDELKPDATVKLNLNFVKGWNRLFIKARVTAAGFGCLFGSDEAKVRILNVRSPFAERAGQAGWVYSAPIDADLFEESPLPAAFSSEKEQGVKWLPESDWREEELALQVCERLFGLQPGKRAYAWTQLNATGIGKAPYVLKGSTTGPLAVWVNGHPVAAVQTAGSFEVEVPLAFGKHDMVVRSECEPTSQAWGFTVQAYAGGDQVPFHAPVDVHGSDEVWLYLGPFDANVELNENEIATTKRVFAGNYWRLDRPETWIRPYYENAMLSNKWTVGHVTNFARWDYPLGVTIYGLLQTGRLLERPDILSYALAHVQSCTDMFEYSLWDREQYGFPAINQQLVMMKMLDNCGSFGSAMLESYKEAQHAGYLPIAHRIADFMLQQLERKEDGAFYRVCQDEYSENTMWADDLYMSTPFLCRYAAVTGNREALDEAAKQFLLFRNYLFMPEQRIMSHVFDFKYGMPTRIPWGRGNGWTLFSLTEVLEALPADHALRAELVRFFNELCAGYAELQAASGLWHQVLNDPDAYQEASCTAMFAYSFARGVRFGWLAEPQRFIQAALKAWDGLTRYAIDAQGNVHGVCSGSRYAFTADYYKKDLLTVTNDNHGVGIMMLAGTEIVKLKGWLREPARWD